MDDERTLRLEKAGWAVADAEEFLRLSEEEATYVEMKLALSRSLKERRTALGLTQAALAKRLGSSQSRVAKMEAADPTVSIDLLIRGLLGTGAREKDIARAIARAKRSAA